MSHLIFFLFVFACAFSFAKLEINIEGVNGWASKLPTWRKTINLPILRNHEMTGYHFWQFVCFLPLVIHLPFLFLPWSFAVEAKILAFYLLMTSLEDFLWFVLNPAYGIKTYTPNGAKWHKKWILFLPVEIWITSICGAVLYYLSVT
jgi:hypothetical protein